MRYKAVFFDFDGTVMDTSEGIFEGGRTAMTQMGLDIPENAVWRSFIGPPLAECFRIVFNIQDRETLDKLVEHYRVYYFKEGFEKAKFYPGITEVLKELKNRGYKLGIATMKNEDLAEKMCRYFGIYDYFDGIFGLNLAGTNRKADVLKDGFAKFGLKPSECVLVGDTEIDSQGARAAGCDCIKCNWGFGYYPGDKDTISEAKQILDLV